MLFSQGFYTDEEMHKARAMKIAFDEETRQGPTRTRSIAVSMVRAMNKEVFKGFSVRDISEE
jgi:hypothetical protein